MLTKRQNLLETIRGGNPDRFVNQYEAFMCTDAIYGMIMGDPISAQGERPMPGGEPKKNAWGVTYAWPENVPAGFPVHDQEHKVIKDITKWKEVVKAPKTDFPPEAWAPFLPAVEAIDRNEVFATAFVAPGIFEQCHHLMGMDDALLNFYEEPEAMHELIDYFTEYELRYAAELVKYYKPDCIFHHDDWGSSTNSFLSPAMFEEFIVPAYKKIYGFYKENGVELIVHHSDSYAANLVPYMIEVGIDIFQGCIPTNNVPELIKKYGGQISFMGNLDSAVVDTEDWTDESIEAEVRQSIEKCGKHYYIPCIAQGGPGSIFPGVYESISKAIDKMSEEKF
ncbi:uroporphyrinogen decarboxylase [Alkalibacter rhizosphaerae]|uniref:Uroporphyrinogen decarboxylase n=1 Tax=Alkalibacter rhizosphaerae TaxID=2815577 RepID=A0A974XEN8_9FIRM|nr:uroporphyrinogen decarboxylase family protein [Alkalibacter rhizosphaerae]QSX08462.1 uroporphyrinogen decarboxylase [Alkalibacter rhizosphaerae]